MYDYDRRVYVKSAATTGTISERNFLTVNGRRRAQYIVQFPDGSDYLTGSEDLRAADFCCDGCDRWLPMSSKGDGPRDSDGYLLALFCFLCIREAEQDYRKGWF